MCNIYEINGKMFVYVLQLYYICTQVEYMKCTDVYIKCTIVTQV